MRNLDTVVLKHGAHSSPGDGLCAMEAEADNVWNLALGALETALEVKL